MLTRVFKSGNSMAVRIPKDIQFAGNVQEVDIERHGDTQDSRHPGLGAEARI